MQIVDSSGNSSTEQSNKHFNRRLVIEKALSNFHKGTLLNTAIDHEMDQMGRFLNMVIDYKHKIGFEGSILIEPKPQEPTKHQYDFDVATVYGFLKRYGIDAEIKVNIEQGHAILAGNSFKH